MLPLAIFLDILGLIEVIPVIGSALSYIPDLIGLIFIGGWMYFRSGRVEIPERAERRFKGKFRKLFRGKYKKFLIPILGEAIPFVGIFSFWIFAVYFELTSE